MAASEGEEEDDYMSMTFLDPTPTEPSSSLRRQQQKRKHAELKGRPKSKKELEAEAAAAREAGLSKSLDPSNKGAKMMAKLGYKGGALGKTEGARTAPVQLQIKDDRGGIGMDSEKKRKVREAMEEAQGKDKRRKADESEYRERTAREREEKRQEGMMWGAMRIVEKFDMDAAEEAGQEGATAAAAAASAHKSPSEKPSHPKNNAKVNVLWRSLARQRADRDKTRKQRLTMLESLSSLRRQADTEEDSDDRIALGTEVEELEDDEDAELDEFNALEPAERLQRIVAYLRTTYNYCFWCKYRYPDSDMEGCPGLTEEDHD